MPKLIKAIATRGFETINDKSSVIIVRSPYLHIVVEILFIVSRAHHIQHIINLIVKPVDAESENRMMRYVNRVMSMESNYYVIAGYDLTDNKTDKFDDWKWLEEGEDYICNQRKGEIQFFNDPMSSSYLYFGYVLASGNEYSFDTEMFEMSDIERCSGKVKSELVKLQELGVITKDTYFKPAFKIIVFEECK